jgi:hypothetical protein
MATRRRGRPPRAGVRANCRIELKMTPAELDALREYAKRQQATSLADAVRLALLDLAADGEPPTRARGAVCDRSERRCPPLLEAHETILALRHSLSTASRENRALREARDVSLRVVVAVGGNYDRSKIVARAPME